MAQPDNRAAQLGPERERHCERRKQPADDESFEKQSVDPGHAVIPPREMARILSQVDRLRQLKIHFAR